MKKQKNAVLSLFIMLCFAATIIGVAPFAQAHEIAKLHRIINFKLLETQTDDAFWAGKENMLYHYPHISVVGLDDQSTDWFGMDKDSTGADHRWYSEIGFDTTMPNTATQEYYFKNLPSQGKTSRGEFTMLIQYIPAEPVKPVMIRHIDITSWATPAIELHQTSRFAGGDEGHAGCSGSYDPETNAIYGHVNLNLDFRANGTQNAWVDGYEQAGYLIPNSEFVDLPGSGSDYPITIYCPGNPGGGYPNEYIPCGTVDIGEWLAEIVELDEVEDEAFLYVGVSRDNFKNDETQTAGKRFEDGGNFFVVDASEWPILNKPFLNMESVWVAVSKPLQAIPAIPKK